MVIFNSYVSLPEGMTNYGFWRAWPGRKVNMGQLKVWDDQIFGGLISNITTKKLQVHPKKDTK